MKQLTLDKLHTQSIPELSKLVDNIEYELVELKMKKATAALKNVREYKFARKYLARIKTIRQLKLRQPVVTSPLPAETKADTGDKSKIAEKKKVS
jgi:ribosomal protein L29